MFKEIFCGNIQKEGVVLTFFKNWIEAEICRGSDYPPDYCTARARSVSESVQNLGPIGAVQVIVKLNNGPEWLTHQVRFVLDPGSLSNVQAGGRYAQVVGRLLPVRYDLEFGDNWGMVSAVTCLLMKDVVALNRYQSS